MNEGIAVAFAAIVALTGQGVYIFLEGRKRRVDSQAMMKAAARLVRDDISASMEAVHQSISTGCWWSDEYDLDASISVDDRRLLAARADAETLRRSFGSVRRYRQLQFLRRRQAASAGVSAASISLTEAQRVETVAVFLDLALARRLLSPYTGYGSAPFSRPAYIPGPVLRAGLRSAAIDDAAGLFIPLAVAEE